MYNNYEYCYMYGISALIGLHKSGYMPKSPDTISLTWPHPSIYVCATIHIGKIHLACETSGNEDQEYFRLTLKVS